MKRIFFIVVLLSLFQSALLFAETSEDEKIQLAMLMNQVQYTTSTIIQNKDKVTLFKFS